MAEVGVAFVSIVPTAAGFGSKLNAQTGAASLDAGTSGGKKFGGAFSGAAGAATKGLAKIFAVGAVIKGVQSVVAEAREAEKVSAITENRIKTMGNASNISATQIGNLANAIAKKTGVDDEAIQSGANLLLTFKNVREEVGKGNDVFTRATQVITDMSREKGMGGLEASSIRLGKALNDPVKGITALSRVGVQFSADQKKAIKEMVATGDILGAQKIILKELETQFGGTAEAAATSGEKVAQSWGQVKEQLGTALLPLLDSLATILIENVLPALQKFADWAVANPGAFKAIAIAIGLVGLALLGVAIFAAGIPLLIGLVVIALVALFAYLWTKTDELRAFLKSNNAEIERETKEAWTRIGEFLKTNNTALETETNAAWARIRGAVSQNNRQLETETDAIWSSIGSFLASTWSEIQQEAGTAWAAIRSGAATAWGTIVAAIRTRVNQIVSTVGTLPGKLRGVFSGAGSWLVSAGRAIMEGLIKGIQWGISKVEALLNGVTSKIPSWKGPPSTDKKLLYDNGQLILLGLIGGMTSREGELKSTLNGLTKTIGNTSTPPGIGGGFSPANVAGPAAAGDTQPSDADSIGRAVAKYLVGGTFRMDNRGNLQLISAGG